MKRFLGLVLMTEGELDKLLMEQEERYLRLAEQFVEVDLELMKRKASDPRRPLSIIGNVLHTFNQKVIEK